MNLKTLLRYALPFANTASLFRWRAGSRRQQHKPFFIFEGRTYSYGETLRAASSYANLFLDLKQNRIRAGEMAPSDGLRVGIYQHNSPEFVFAYFGAALSGSVLFGINTGFRGDTLATVIQQAKMQLLFTERELLGEIEPLLGGLDSVPEVLLSGPSEQAEGSAHRSLRRALQDLARRNCLIDRAPKLPIDNSAPFIVIYTSGTTGAPKGVLCSQLKMFGTGVVATRRLGLSDSDRGYVCMPLFHSNAWFLGVMPLLLVGGSFLLTRRFSASAFEDDILDHGVSYMNYVGQPIHYILSALENKHGSPEAVEAALRHHPRNRFRIAHGNGAPAADRTKLMRYLGMEHVYELYGATEAAIHTCNMPGDPIDSVGRVHSRSVQILNERDQPCEAGVVDSTGRLTNYDKAVGEICRKIDQDNLLFDGYFNNQGATRAKYRDGWFRSGDLGHIRVVRRKRYLFFNGRTDDWIRKDGENFSAESVAAHVGAHPHVAIAAAYGAPSPVADERVMVALELRGGCSFDPDHLFGFLSERQRSAGMDPKWVPDYVRVCTQLPMTKTQKVVVRQLKREHFNLARNPELVVFQRRRGDTTFHPFDADAYAELVRAFEQTGRQALLDEG